MVVEAKFYCPCCNKIWGESEVSREIGVLVGDPEHPYVCPGCGCDLEYAIWKPMVEAYTKICGKGFEEAERKLRSILVEEGHDGVEPLYDLAECLGVALQKVYGKLNPQIFIKPYTPAESDCWEDDLDAVVEVEKKNKRFEVILESLGRCPFWIGGNLWEILGRLDKFLRKSIEAWKIYFSD